MTPFETSLPAINKIAINPAHQLLGFGGSNGAVEFWTHNDKKKIAGLDVLGDLMRHVDSTLLESVPEITAIEFGDDGLSVLCGTSTGQVLLYDLRNPTPVVVKDHQYGFPIKSLGFHASGRVISADTKIVKLWDRETVSI